MDKVLPTHPIHSNWLYRRSETHTGVKKLYWLMDTQFLQLAVVRFLTMAHLGKKNNDLQLAYDLKTIYFKHTFLMTAQVFTNTNQKYTTPLKNSYQSKLRS